MDWTKKIGIPIFQRFQQTRAKIKWFLLILRNLFVYASVFSNNVFDPIVLCTFGITIKIVPAHLIRQWNLTDSKTRPTVN